MKIVKRFLKILAASGIIAAAAVIINAKTVFFRDIGSHFPFLKTHCPYLVEYISETSDKVNAFISQIPTAREIYAMITHKEIPLAPDDIAHNVYYSSDSMLNFYSKENVSVTINGNSIDVYGISPTEHEKYLIFRFLDSAGETLSQDSAAVSPDGRFRKQLDIPENTHQFTIFTGAERYGKFTSYIYDYLFFTRSSDGEWSFARSPVYDSNIEKYEKNKSISAALKKTYAICSDSPAIVSLAKAITDGYETDYEKAEALHDWVCENIYYDLDSISGNRNRVSYVADDVLRNSRAVCLGYANLYASLCRSVGIPCSVVTGYALGADGSKEEWNSSNLSTKEANHAWNEVYADNRWIIADPTWNSQNRIENGARIKGDPVSHLYFDANIMFFSTNHRIIDYE